MYPNLDACVSQADVATKGTGKFAADYVPWPRIARYLRKHAPGWQPFAEKAPDGKAYHEAPDGTVFLLIGFRHPDPEQPDTECIPHAVMNNRMQAKLEPDARDIADAFVRGMCKAAALLFGLGDKLWDKDDPFERDNEQQAPQNEQQAPQAAPAPSPYLSPEAAAHDLGQITNEDAFPAWWAKVVASGFLAEELETLKEAGAEHRAKLKDAQDA